MSVTLRTMRWPDIARVHDIEQQVFGGEAWTVEQFWAELAQPTRRYFVAVADDHRGASDETTGDQGAIVGYAGAYCLPPDADVQTIAVAAEWVGRGIGRRLLTELLRIAVGEGCTQMMLEVRSDNVPAIALYGSEHFEQISVRRGYYAPGVDALIMRARPIGGEHGDSVLA